MARKSGPMKTTMSITVLPETRDMLTAKSEACGQTLSDLVQIAVVEKYSPRRGLANRLENIKDEAILKHKHELESIQHALTEEKQRAEDKAALAIRQSNDRLKSVTDRCEAQWEASLQKRLLSYDLTVQADLRH